MVVKNGAECSGFPYSIELAKKSVSSEGYERQLGAGSSRRLSFQDACPNSTQARLKGNSARVGTQAEEQCRTRFMCLAIFDVSRVDPRSVSRGFGRS
jgi:hypothetical protein